VLLIAKVLPQPIEQYNICQYGLCYRNPHEPIDSHFDKGNLIMKTVSEVMKLEDCLNVSL